MRDAYGGTFMLELMMVFIVLFVSFTAVIVNVAKTFRIKNEIINVIEKQGGYTTDAGNKINDYLDRAGYQIVEQGNKCSGANDTWEARGYCITSEDDGSYYKVTVYVSISLPFQLLTKGFYIPVSGETEVHNLYQIK